MKAEEVNARADRALNDLASELEAGKSDQYQAYLAAIARFPNYSWGNVALIVSQRPDASLVAGYQAWKKLGRQVKRGEKAIGIRAPLVGKKADEASGEEKTVRGFRVVHVFDVAQTEGDPIPELATTQGDPENATEKLKGFVSWLGIDLDYSDSIYPAQGRSHGGKITLVPGLSPAEEFNVLAHELAHEILHADNGKSLSKTVRETEAEAVAFAVSSAYGLDGTIAASDYIQSHDGSKDTLAASLGRIQSAVVRIVQGMELDQEHEAQQAPHRSTEICPVPDL